MFRTQRFARLPRAFQEETQSMRVCFLGLVMVAIVAGTGVPVLLGVDVASFWRLTSNTSDGWMQGSDKFSTTSWGYEWLFGNADDLKSFMEEPSKIAPSYGGFCAYALATENILACVQPRAWYRVHDRLFFT